jgi:hypothetical protein
MAAKVRSRLTYANVVSTLCLFLLIGGGGAYAAVSLGKGVVKGRNIAKNAVTSSKVKDSSLLARDFARGQLPKGEKGDTGARGAPGANGEPGAKGDPGTNGGTNVTVVRDAATAAPMSTAFGNPHCPPGQRATGGGVGSDLHDPGDTVIQSGPVGADNNFNTLNTGGVPTGWFGRWRNSDASTTRTVIVYVICAAP